MEYHPLTFDVRPEIETLRHFDTSTIAIAIPFSSSALELVRTITLRTSVCI